MSRSELKRKCTMSPIAMAEKMYEQESELSVLREKNAKLELDCALYAAEENRIWEFIPELRNTDSQYELHEAVHEKIARLEAENRKLRRYREIWYKSPRYKGGKIY